MRAALALLLALLLAPGARAADDALHTFELRHRPAAEVLPLVRPLLAPGDGASGSGFLLFVRTDPRRLAEIERLLAAIDVAARTLTITVRQGSARELAEAEHGVSARVEIGERATVRLPGREDPSTGVRVGDDNVTYRARSRAQTGGRMLAQTLRVRDGERAYVRLGQSVPHVQRLLALHGRHAVVAQGVVFEEATSGFEVLPRVRGETVHLEIAPCLTLSRSPDGVVTFQELRTAVTTRLGEWIDLSELLGAASEIHREILAAGRTQAQDRQTVLLRVD